MAGFSVIRVGLAWALSLGLVAAELSSVAEVRALSRAEAAQALPVRLRGVVIWQDADTRPAFFLHDGNFSIWIDRSTAHARGLWQGGDPPADDCAVGSLVEVEGVTDPGGYAPCVIPLRFSKLGTGGIPVARKVPLERLLSGSEDGQVVELDGVVQDVTPPDKYGDSRIMLMVDGHPCRVAAEHGRGLDHKELIDARVWMRGIVVPLPNLRSEVAGLRMNIMGREWLHVTEPPPPDPFSAPRVSLDRLLPFNPDTKPFHRKVTSGVVTLSVPGKFFFIQEGERGVRVQSASEDVMPGDLVDVAGFIDTSQTIASLNGALVRRTGRTDMPAALDVTADRIMNPVFRNSFEKVSEADYHGRRVRVSGQVVRIERGSNGEGPCLLVASGGHVFPVRTAGSGWPLPSTWVEGASLDLTGVAELEFNEDENTQGSFSITGMGFWIGSPADVVVTSVPSWWTPQRLGLALGGTGLVLALVMGWNFALRRLLWKRSLMLEEVMRKHRDSELEFHGARQERRRLAGDLHDGLQQLMAGAAYRMEAAAAHLGEVPPAVETHLTAARRALVRSQEGLREVLWGLQHMEDDSDDFAALLRHAVASVEHWQEGAVEVVSSGEPFPISRQVQGSLLLLMQETVGNAFKHGAARKVRVSVSYDGGSLGMEISDDGCGFDPAGAPGPREGHFGLESIRLRMKWLGGTATVRSRPAEGTVVSCRIPAALAKTNVPLKETPPQQSGHGYW